VNCFLCVAHPYITQYLLISQCAYHLQRTKARQFRVHSVIWIKKVLIWQCCLKGFFIIISFYRWEKNLLLSLSLLIESDAKCFPDCKITALPKQLSPVSISLNRWHSRQRNLLREINPRCERALFSNWWTYGLKVIDSWCNRIAWKLAGVIWKPRFYGRRSHSSLIAFYIPPSPPPPSFLLLRRLRLESRLTRLARSISQNTDENSLFAHGLDSLSPSHMTREKSGWKNRSGRTK